MNKLLKTICNYWQDIMSAAFILLTILVSSLISVGRINIIWAYLLVVSLIFAMAILIAISVKKQSFRLRDVSFILVALFLALYIAIHINPFLFHLGAIRSSTIVQIVGNLYGCSILIRFSICLKEKWNAKK
jgi:hypothetical protein